MEESVEDMTAAETAPKPMNATHDGVRYWIKRKRYSRGEKWMGEGRRGKDREIGRMQ